MAVAWARRIGTIYAKDRRFVKNFFRDFRKVLNLKEKVAPELFDFGEIVDYLEKQKQEKERTSPEEKLRLAVERKEKREKLRSIYGHATVDGTVMELENYVAEPSGIFFGCAKHPIRGRWKRGPTQEDVVLNLSPDAKIPPGNWKQIVWRSDMMWIAQWKCPLTKKMKYVWLASSTPIKQAKDVAKFDKAVELGKNIEKVRETIAAKLTSEDVITRKLATVAYIIDSLNMRVGDEKDADEAETIGATTLKRDNITIEANGKGVFDFYGKGAVKWHKERTFPPTVINNLQAFMQEPDEQVFNGVTSKRVNEFLDSIMPGLTAKVFRTLHATEAVENALAKSHVKPEHDDYIKKHALVMANLSAAIVCNHRKQPPKNWREQLEKKKARLEQLRKRKSPSARKQARKLELKIREMRMIRDYNLRTSLKSYIDPRVVLEWCRQTGTDWKEYYPETFYNRFAWAEAKPADNPPLLNRKR